jgi:hypothetical protein
MVPYTGKDFNEAIEDARQRLGVENIAVAAKYRPPESPSEHRSPPGPSLGKHIKLSRGIHFKGNN